MTIMLIGFVIFTTLVWFFGTAMAYLAWRVLESDSDKVIQQSRQKNAGVTSPPKKHQTVPRNSQSTPTSSGSRRSYTDKRQTVSPRSGEA